MSNRFSNSVRTVSIGVAISAALISTLTGCANPMSQRSFDQSEAWEHLEAALQDSVEALTDFPGFEKRGLFLLDCEDAGQVNYEVHYAFTAEDSATPLVREEYPELLKQHWEDRDFEVHRDDSNEQLGWRDLEARTPEGVNLWYPVWDGVRIVAQSGCVDRVEDFAEPCPAPLGGVSEENDTGLKLCESGYRSEDQAAAVDPFSKIGATNPNGLVPWQTFRGAEDGLGRFDGQL